MTPPPLSRDDFPVAIVCALPIEYDAVSLPIDQSWDEDGGRYGRAAGDNNRYTTGRIGSTDVVLVLLAKMGKASAARTAVGLRFSFPRLQLVLLTGICGGAPTTTKGEEVLLGDVVISKSIVQHDFGRQNTDGFATKDRIEDVLGPPARHVQTLVTYLETVVGRSRLQGGANVVLQALQKNVLTRQGDMVVRCGEDRERLFERHKVVGFEMEGAGLWGELPCLVVKGVCDYADSHKNKGWQDFAAATAAATAKMLLELFIRTETPVTELPSGVKPGGATSLSNGRTCFSVPFSRNKRFVGRTMILKTLTEKLFTDEACPSVVLVGLGGMGKTQVALQ
ncbi:hypothetical protein ACHAQH_010123, partial [Verticillium albo-atrum]